MKKPILSKNLEGGIWRIRQLHRCTVSKQKTSSHKSATEKFLAIGAMNGGFYLINADNFEIIGSNKEHNSLAYGIDFECNTCLLGNEVDDNDEKCWIASCSFYDHMLKLWSCEKNIS
jgi:hypothetical protein